LYKNSAVSDSTRKPWASPGGIHICLWFCAVN